MSALRFEIQATCPETGARAGLLHTAHGVVETPVFMPVGTQGTVKGLTPRDLERDLGAKIILANTYHLFLRPGHERIERLGGLHEFMSWPHAILTDSGGFQVFSLDTLRKVTEEGVLFRSHLNGDAHFFTPETIVDIQLSLGSDIAMVLDECLPYPVTHEAAMQSVERTVRWARTGYAHYESREKKAGGRVISDRARLDVPRSSPILRRISARTECARLCDRWAFRRGAARVNGRNHRRDRAAFAA